MPLPVVSPTLFNAQALAADPADTHLQPGIHLRVAAHPLLGLPVAPFVVWRATSTDAGAFEKVLRTDVVYVDSRGRLLEAPFELTPGNPVTAYLALKPGEVCLWAMALADPAPALRGGVRGGVAAQPARSARPAPQAARSVRELFAGARGAGTRGAAGLAAGALASGIVCTAYVSTSRGPAPIAQRSEPQYSFTGPGIVQIRLEGNGDVGGVWWLEQKALPTLDWMPWEVLNLPHPGGPRYLSIDGALLRAAARVLAQAPLRRPLQETIGAVPPAAAPPEGPLYEAKRVDSLMRPLAPDLDRLITDLGAPQLELVASDPILDEREAEIGTVTQRCIDRLQQGQLDPGGAALLGYKALDREFKDPQPLLVLYWVTGLFRDFPPSALVPPADPIFDAQLALLAGDNRVGNEKALVALFDKLIGNLNIKINTDTVGQLEQHDDYIGLGALAIADRLTSPGPMAAPAIDSTLHVGWLPVVPPAARREVQVFVAGVATGGLLAAEKHTPAVGPAAREPLNKSNADGYHLPLVLAQNSDDETLDVPTGPGTGFVADRAGAPLDIRYLLAQQDGFGRWSDWVSAIDAPGPRPKPPRPVPRAFYTRPADPAASGGSVRVMVDVPALATLAPASFPIEELRLTWTDLTTHVASTLVQSVGDPLAPAAALDFAFTGPPLAPTERRELELVAVWVDTEGGESVPSEPQRVAMNDPRPPAQITLPATLQYSGRPDVLGLSMVEYAWTTVPGQSNWGVYYTDENRLVAYLEGFAAGSVERDLFDTLASITDPAARATELRDKPALFPSHLFERLQGVVFDSGANQKSFRHAVSGSLRVLNVYRVAAESATSARVDLSTLPLLIFAVPNADPPPRPVLQVVPADMAANTDAYAANVTITLTAGVTTAANWRLRRSSLGATDVLRMPVVTTGPMGVVEADGRQRGSYDDAGPVQISPAATLKPWVRYTWVAECQGDFAPGSVAAGRPVPGLWSSPSDPVSLMLVPPQAPGAPQALAAAGTPAGAGQYAGVALTFLHAEALAGGVAGPYRARIQRRKPGAPMEALAVVDVGPAPFKLGGMRPDDAADLVPAGTLYRVSLIDPLGREGAAAEVELA
jgi:hypothetical protein